MADCQTNKFNSPPNIWVYSHDIEFKDSPRQLQWEQGPCRQEQANIPEQGKPLSVQ